MLRVAVIDNSSSIQDNTEVSGTEVAGIVLQEDNTSCCSHRQQQFYRGQRLALKLQE